MYVLVFQRKPSLHLMNGTNSLKHVQHFDAHNSNQNQEKERKKEENIQFITLRNACYITVQNLLS